MKEIDVSPYKGAQPDKWYFVGDNTVGIETYADALKAERLIKISGDGVRLDSIQMPPANFYVGLSPNTPPEVYRAAVKRRLKLCALTNGMPVSDWAEKVWFVSEQDKLRAGQNLTAILNWA